MLDFPRGGHLTCASLVLAVDIPLQKMVAGVRVGLLEGEGYVVNPTNEQMELSKLDLIIAGTADAVLMIEGYCDFLSEDVVMEVGKSCFLRDVV